MSEYLLSLVKISFIASPFIILLCLSSGMREKISVGVRLKLMVFLCILLIVAPNSSALTPFITINVPQKTLSQVYIPQLTDQDVAEITAKKDVSEGVLLPQAPTSGEVTNVIKKPLPRAKIFYVPLLDILFYIWVLGFLLFCGFNLASYIRFKKTIEKGKLKSVQPKISDAFIAVCEEKNIGQKVGLIQSKSINSPFLMGVLQPCIVMPVRDFEPLQLEIIFRHELGHYQNGDLWIKLLALLSNALHFFNPLAYLMRKIIGEDMEILCDEKTVENASLSYKKYYSLTILQLCSSQNFVLHSFITEVSGGKSQLKNRFKAILSPQSAKKGVALALCLALLTTSLTACYNVKPLDNSQPDTEVRVVTDDIKQGIWQTVYPVAEIMRSSDITDFQQIKDSKDLLSFAYTYTMYYIKVCGLYAEFMGEEDTLMVPLTYVNEVIKNTFGTDVTFTKEECLDTLGKEILRVEDQVYLCAKSAEVQVEKQLFSDKESSQPFSAQEFTDLGNGKYSCTILDVSASSDGLMYTFTLSSRADGGYLVESGSREAHKGDNSKGYDIKNKFISPLSADKAFRITRGFTQEHPAINLAAPAGAEIYATLEGTVSKVVSDDEGLGNYLVIDHADGLSTTYGHCSEILVKEGDKVITGQLIGKVGKTGDATGNNLYFAISYNGEPIDFTKDQQGIFDSSSTN
ncbi:MAG: M23/M56 family metallopeptidase [Oscillospiraceae bacterium]